MTEQDLGRLRISEPGELSDEEIVANLRCVNTTSINPEEAAELENGVRAFLENLSDESFRMRFGRPKPTDPGGYDIIVRNFLYNSTHPPEVVTLTNGDELIGACSIFQHQLRSKPGGELVDSEHIVELSLTVADGYQRRGIGTTLLEAASRLAADDGKLYAYCSFEPGNEASRKLVRSVLGSANLVAGTTNPTDKYYRLPADNSEPPDYDYSELERYMHIMCGELPAEELAIGQTETLRTPKLRKYGRRALRALRYLAYQKDSS